MTKNEIDKKLSLYGECFNLRFYTSEKKYYLSSPSFNPMLIAVYSENDRDKALHLFEVLESLFQSWKKAEKRIIELEKELELYEHYMVFVPSSEW